MTRTWRYAVAVLLLIAASSCRQSRAEAPLPPPPAIVDVVASEYRFDYGPEIPAGRVVFQLHNVGHVNHRITLYPLTEEIPPINVQLHGSERRVVPRFAGVAPVSPGEVATFAVDLTPGVRYALVCFELDNDGVVHAMKGMNSEFRASGEAANARTPPR